MSTSTELTDSYGDSVKFVAYSYDPGTVDVHVTHGDKVYAITRLDPNALRDAIDEAVGKRETAADDSVDQRLVAWDQVAGHKFFESCFDADGTLLDAMIEKLDSAHLHRSYPDKTRTAHLNHIADVEAALARRNEQRLVHEARIRELEAEVKEFTTYAEEVEGLTAREYLKRAWTRAIVPEDGEIHRGEAFLALVDGEVQVRGVFSAPYSLEAREEIIERRLLDPRVEPTRHPKAQEIEDQLIESIGCGVLTDEELARAADDLAGRCAS